MFAERLKLILNATGAKVPDLAHIIGCDRSNLDRILKGVRIPRKQGKSIWRIVQALYLYADEKMKMDQLIECYSGENTRDPEQIQSEIINWLYEGEKEEPIKVKPRKDLNSYRFFGQKIDAVMKLTELSNIRLGKMLNVDASYISRFRNGFASPVSNEKLMNKTCEVMLEQLTKQDKLPQLAKLMGVRVQEIKDTDIALELFHDWLFPMEEKNASPFILSLVDQVGSFNAGVPAPTLSFEETTGSSFWDENTTTYYGEDGLRRAVIRFLGNVVRRKEKELYLYSDQNMDWMVSDPLFREKWSSLMTLCVTGGTRIHIIHNISRELSEMNNAILSWLPLYPSGMIHSYYCKLPSRVRFSMTLFLCPGYACIAGSNVVGTEKEKGMYRYDTDPAQLEAHKAAYQELLLRSGELVHAHNTTDSGTIGGKDITSISVLDSTLSLATMPEETLRKAMKRTGATAETTRHLLNVRRKRFEAFEWKVKSGYVHEYMPLPAYEDIFDGCVLMDLPGLSVTYTLEEYDEHIRNIISLLETYPNYRIVLLPEAPFKDIKLLISEQVVAVVRKSSPYITIQFEHSELCRAFISYAETLQNQYKQDRLSVRRILEDLKPKDIQEFFYLS